MNGKENEEIFEVFVEMYKIQHGEEPSEEDMQALRGVAVYCAHFYRKGFEAGQKAQVQA